MFRLTLPKIAILAHLGPSVLALILAPRFGYNFSAEGTFVMLTSIVATLAGFMLSLLIPKSSTGAQADLPDGTLILLSYTLLLVGAVAMAANFFAVRSIPLLNGGIGRIDMSHSILWNIYVLCGIGAFFYAHEIRTAGKTRLIGNFLIAIYVALGLASAWKGTVLFVLILFATPLLHGKQVRTRDLLIAVAAFAILFFAVNGMREGNTISALIRQPMFYLIWGYVNFDSEALSHVSTCIHSIPGFGCQFGLPNEILINPAYNVYSALTPLYIDGGPILVFLVFAIMAFAVNAADRRPRTPFTSYVLFLGVYFFVMAHNGYTFYSKTFLAGIIIVTAVTIVGKIGLRRLPGRPLVK